MKKSQISSQFNWIFILIIGAVILTFFISIVSKQKDQAETKISINVVMSFKTILQSSLVKERSTQAISMPKQTLEFYCELDTCTTHGCYSGYRVEGSSVDVSSDLMSIFSPRKISGKKMITYSLDWNLPFKTLNFLFVTSDDVRYILVRDSLEDYKTVMKHFPDNITLDVVNSSSLDSLIDEGFYNVRYIFLNDDSTLQSADLIDSVGGKNSKNVSAVNLEFESGSIGFGKISYYSHLSGVKVKTGESYFIDNATMVAAIFSDDSEIYDCNLIKAFNRLGRLAGVYEQKINNLCNLYCNDFLTCGSVLYDSNLARTMKNVAFEIVSKQSISEDDAKTIENSFKGLEAMNMRARDYSCPVLY
ncbi:hypothetical protein JXM83_06075 [Candidatus Woesearchaeota archaeon]|nr:hypothetical protein [Candidatus Woesearchaeota archaeon]